MRHECSYYITLQNNSDKTTGAGKTVVRNELHKITNNILQSLMSLCKKGDSKTQINESLP
jgi:hypothetical protein